MAQPNDRQTLYESQATLVARVFSPDGPAIVKSLKASAQTPQAINRYYHEFNVVQSLTSPYVCRAIEYDRENHQLVFEDCGGESLRDRLRKGPIATEAAVTIADTFWRTSWPGTFTGTYSPPTVVGLYDGTRQDAPFCGTFQLLPNNAFYCPFNDSVAWDVTLMAEGYLFGDAWVYLVVAHEWAHAVQARIDPSLVWVGSELQADCWAGATLFGSSADALFIGNADGSLVFEDGDQQELEDGLASLGNRLPWTDSRSHGNAEQRIAAFERGRDGGIEGCFPVDDGTFRSPASTGLR